MDSSSRLGEIRIWAVADGAQVAVFKEHLAYVSGVVFTPDGRRLISGGADRSMIAWDIAAKKAIAKERLLSGEG